MSIQLPRFTWETIKDIDPRVHLVLDFLEEYYTPSQLEDSILELDIEKFMGLLNRFGAKTHALVNPHKDLMRRFCRVIFHSFPLPTFPTTFLEKKLKDQGLSPPQISLLLLQATYLVQHELSTPGKEIETLATPNFVEESKLEALPIESKKSIPPPPHISTPHPPNPYGISPPIPRSRLSEKDLGAAQSSISRAARLFL